MWVPCSGSLHSTHGSPATVQCLQQGSHMAPVISVRSHSEVLCRWCDVTIDHRQLQQIRRVVSKDVTSQLIPCFICLDWTIATHCRPVYHAPPSNHKAPCLVLSSSSPTPRMSSAFSRSTESGIICMRTTNRRMWMCSYRTLIKHGLHSNTASLTLGVGVHHEDYS